MSKGNLKNYNFDLIRLLAMTGVVVDHYISWFGSNMLKYSGLQVGGGSVTISILLSAFLFGIQWRENKYRAFNPFGFMRKRYLRIFIPLWLSILIVLPLEYLLVHRFEPSTIIFNAVGLCWARPFGVAGHLWYITMLMILYVIFCVISRFRLGKIKGVWWIVTFIILIVVYSLFQEQINTYSKAGPPLFIFFSVLMFTKGESVSQISKNNRYIILVLTLVMVAISMFVYQLGWHDTHKSLAIGSFICSGFLSFLTMTSFLDIKRKYPFITRIADISYEIYLVHLPLLALSNHYIGSLIIRTPIWVISTVLCAILLKKTSKQIIYKIC